MFEGAFYLVIFIATSSGSTHVMNTQLLSLEMENEKACEQAQRQMDRQINALHAPRGLHLVRYSLTCVPKNEKKEKE